MKILYPAVGIFSTLVNSVYAGPEAYRICQAGYAAVVTACYSAAGFTWGATLTLPEARLA
ncbi:uncharacterized protein BDW43DRAFT_240834 [Aspergillus alliaceus]|uniref:uncharacterized protein n=1 Tax=Petromyces alliaceus TaxID=209559 RepID=UPI0012A3DC65|nr:uncharacterized protein BDW43DRAFT_240834 [Aspergillus alliaceus]KAB8236593.1 hypothetical protein BDW43DRAFT_240834 [Aspergillus alliaceus]